MLVPGYVPLRLIDVCARCALGSITVPGGALTGLGQCAIQRVYQGVGGLEGSLDGVQHLLPSGGANTVDKGSNVSTTKERPNGRRARRQHA